MYVQNIDKFLHASITPTSITSSFSFFFGGAVAITAPVASTPPGALGSAIPVPAGTTAGAVDRFPPPLPPLFDGGL